MDMSRHDLGRRLLPHVLHEQAEKDPGRVLYSVTKSRDPSDGFQDVTTKMFAKAVDRCAWYLEKSLGRGNNFPTLAYIGPQDIVYIVLIIACIKTGYKLLLISPRNTLEADLKLLEETDCHTFLLPPDFALPVVQEILKKREMGVIEISTLQHWLQDGHVEPYAYTKTFEEAMYEPLAIIHTSGTTGLPKPVVMALGMVATLDAMRKICEKDHGLMFPSFFDGKRVYITFPLFHAAGIFMALAMGLYAELTALMGPYPPTADIVNSVILHGNPQIVGIPPAVLGELTKDPVHYNSLGRVELITCGGGPLPREVGDKVQSKTRVLNAIGSTEAGILPLRILDKEDYMYMSPNPVAGVEFRPVGKDGLYEQFIVRDPKLENFQGVFRNFPNLQEWPMRDLYTKHPNKPNLWLYRGRSDDIIVFSNGEKFNPVDLENALSADAAVKAAVVGGVGRFQACLLLEATKPPTNDVEKEHLLDEIWSIVQKLNNSSVAHGRIHRDMILFTSPDKPLAKSDKGTVKKSLSFDIYAAEISALYAAHDAKGINSYTWRSGSSGSAQNDFTSVKEFVTHTLTSISDIDMARVSPVADLYELGLDSLQTSAFTNKTNEYLSAHGKPAAMESRMVYANPTLRRLASVVSALLQDASSETGESSVDMMKQVFERYAADMPISAREPQTPPTDQLVFLLTGSTGSLGSYILQNLANDSNVSKVYCFNRGQNSALRLEKMMKSRGLGRLSDKVECLDVELQKPRFGLSTEKYRELLSRVTNIIHNAWPVNFNHTLGSFEGQIGAVRRFIEFSALSRYGAKIVFISSISTIGRRNDVVPEAPLDDWTSPENMGYGQSKFIAERLLDTAAKEANINTAICRVGQIAGPTTREGMWVKQEWLPSILVSSMYLGLLPESLGPMSTIDWTPVDLLARIIVELTAKAAVSCAGQAKVYHNKNPHQTTWSHLLPIIKEKMDPKDVLRIVSLPKWVEALNKSASKVEDLPKNPAAKILGFAHSLLSPRKTAVEMETRETTNASPTMAALKPVAKDWVENWLDQWGFVAS